MLEYEDRISIVTPEGVTLELTLAGIGSRFVALLIDSLLRIAVLIAIVLLANQIADASSATALVLLFLGTFLVMFVYDVLFETLASGRTPGKRWTGLRVVHVGGGPIGFLTSAIRNLLRIVDSLPGFYLVGMIAVLVSSRNQRLGDMAAGTLVVRERRVAPPAPRTVATMVEDTVSWDVSAVTMAELATIRRFLDRRTELTWEARRRLARELATRLRPKVVGPPERLDDEELLEHVSAAKSARV